LAWLTEPRNRPAKLPRSRYPDRDWLSGRRASSFLVGDRAYKLKKPVRTDFVDFTTRQARLAACLARSR
jgi:aminoglycoside phosphotransferase family enzyme